MGNPQAAGVREYGADEDIWLKREEVTLQWRQWYLICIFHQILCCYQFKENKMEGACDTYEEEDKHIQRFCNETCRKEIP